MKRILLLLIVLLSVSAVAGPTQSFVGTFVELEMGDYAHFIVNDSKGERHSYWLARDPSFDKFVENGPAYKGRKVRVHWRKVMRDIPEAGGEMEIEEATKVELLN